MQIERLRISNFRGFEHLDLKLNRRFTLIIGANGVGKTSFLDALSIAFSAFLIGIPTVQRRHIRANEAREVERNQYDNVEFIQVFPVEIEAYGRVQHPISLESIEVEWRRVLGSERGRTTSVDAKAISRIAELGYACATQNEDPTLPLLSYYGTGRLWNEPKRPKKQTKPSRFDAYKNSHEPRVASADLLSWLRRETLRELESRRDSALLSAWQEAVKACFETDVQIRYSVSRERLEVHFPGQSSAVSYENLSHGQRAVLSMVGDIAFKSIVLNPHLGVDAIEQTEGVVLIDEIDLHLHPRWQRVIVPSLLNAFPKLQFIATTHSPFIIQSLDEGVLLDLDSREIDPPAHNLPLRQIVEDYQNVEDADQSRDHLTKRRLAESYLRKISEIQSIDAEYEKNLAFQDLKEIESHFSDPALAALMRMEKIAKLGEV